MTIDNLSLIDETGKKTSANATSAERKAAFPPLGIINVTKLQWESKGVIHEISLIEDGEKLCWDTLPDLTGIILTNKLENSASRAIIINDDGSNRFVLENPWRKSKFFSPLDSYGFSYPTKESSRIGVVVWVWSPSVTNGVAAEHFYAVGIESGEFLDHHPVK